MTLTVPHADLEGLDRSQIQVLHVDDEPDLAELAAEFVEQNDGRITITTESRAEAGLNRLADESFDCIVSDYDMPGLDGIEFLEIVRDHDHDLPFILFTGKGSEEVASEAISAGVTDYLQKDTGTEQYELLANRIGHAVELNWNERRYRTIKAQYEAMCEQINDGLRIVQDGTVKYVNSRLATMVGFPKKHLLDAPAGEIIAEEYKDVVRNHHARRMRGEEAPTRYEVAIETKVGETKAVELSVSTVPYDSGRASLSVFRDISKRKERERELARATQRYRQLFDSHRDPLIVGNLEREIVDCNPAFTERFGYQLSEIKGERTEILYADPDEFKDLENGFVNSKTTPVSSLRWTIRRSLAKRSPVRRTRSTSWMKMERFSRLLAPFETSQPDRTASEPFSRSEIGSTNLPESSPTTCETR